MKKGLFIVLAAIVVSGLIISGCGDGATPAPAPAPTGVIKLKLAHNYPPPSALGKLFDSWAEKIKADTNGRVEITVYGAGALMKPEEFYEAAVAGVTDISYGMLNGDMSHFALDTVFGLPGMGWTSKWPEVINTRLRVYDELRQKYAAEFEKTQKDVEVLFDVVFPPFVFHSPKKVVRTPEDIKGMRVAATGWFITLANVLGCTPVAMGAPDRYMALEKGTIDGSWDVYGGLVAMKMFEVTNNYLEVDFGDSSGIVIMNKAKFNSLPDDIKKVFHDNRVYGQSEWVKFMSEENTAGRNIATDGGKKLVKITPEEERQWQEALPPLHEAWTKEQESRGLPAKAFLEDALRLIKQYS